MRPLALLSCLLATFATAAEEPTVGFNRDIRPIMSDTCFHCHGFDAKARKGKLRLDLREDALKAGKSGEIAIVPGKPADSEIIKRIFSTDDEDIMPSKEAHKTLTAAQKELFRLWVKQGAVYEPHWAYAKLKTPAVPALPPGGRNAIDAFIGEKLAAKKIVPSAEAPKERLLRRASLDLTGLPPTPEETTRFLADTSADAYERQIDRLLASPHFGERMAVWWLDVARFADTVGYHGDQNQRIFPYRDYVINAFNANKPFDVFTREQLAGDLLPNPTNEQLVASGYNRLNMMTREGGAQAKEYLAKYGAERVRSVSNAWLGSTFGCAECHDHKFDPIKSADFYSLQAFFADVKQWGVYADYSYTPEPELKGVGNDHPFYPEVKTSSPYLKKKSDQAQAEIDALATDWIRSLQADPSRQAAFSAWLKTSQDYLATQPSGWEYPAGTTFFKKGTTPAAKKAAGKIAGKTVAATDSKKTMTPPTPAPTPNPFASAELIQLPQAVAKGDDFVVTLDPIHRRVAAFRIEIAKGALPLATAVNFNVSLWRRDAAGKEHKLGVAVADASHRQPRYNSGFEANDINTGWTLKMPDANVTAVWILDAPLTLDAKESLVVRADANAKLAFKGAVSPLAGLTPLQVNSASLLTTLKSRSPESSSTAVTYLCSAQPDRTLFEKIKALETRRRATHDGETWTMVTQATAPLTVRVLPRGNFLDESGPIVLPATPSFLPGRQESTADKRLNRLDLAHWICSQDNPITARTVMNRLWQIFHGNGLSVGLDDLGSQGDPPSHPELLEWLSSEFRDQGWDMKRMIRLMLTSRTYRQGSSLRPELKELDPNNRLLASQNPRRLEAEFIRDNALAIAGLLNAADIGGPSVKPYQPAGYYEPIQFPSRTYVASTDNEQWRRGLYMHWQRMFLHPMLINFDAPARDECTALRNYSNTPQQALTLLNDPTFVEAARVMATQLVALRATDEQRLNRAYRLAVARDIKPAELTSLRKLLDDQRVYYAANLADADKLLKVGLVPAPTGPAPEIAAWTNVCRAILNSHEVITRY